MARVDRVLTMPGGSLLMAGSSGVGRRTAVSIVSHMHQMQVFSPKIGRGYTAKNFKNDLKTVSRLIIQFNVFNFETISGFPLSWKTGKTWKMAQHVPVREKMREFYPKYSKSHFTYYFYTGKWEKYWKNCQTKNGNRANWRLKISVIL